MSGQTPSSPSSARLTGSFREHAEETIRAVQPATIEVTCCATCGRVAHGSFDLGPKLCECVTQAPMRALYRLVAIADA